MPILRRKGRQSTAQLGLPERLIHTALDSRNPECAAYDPITHGVHQKMLAGKKEEVQKIIRAVLNESDFDRITIKFLKT